MATTRAFGQITIVDVTDVGQFSVYPMSNLTQTVIYSPDDNSYSPDWSASATYLVLTPVVYYAGKKLTLGTSGLNVTWTKTVGVSQNPVAVSASDGEEVVNGVLTVKANQFNSNTAHITYISNATYEEPNSGIELEAQGVIPFSLLSTPSSVRNVSISGDNVFKYNMNNVPNKTSTTLRADATSTLTIIDWEYYKQNANTNEWEWISLSNASSTLNIDENSNIFSGDTVYIRVVTRDNMDSSKYYYDYITVMKLRDGTAAGNSLSLSNENQSIPCTINATTGATSPTSTAFNKSYTAVSIMKEGEDVTSQYTVTAYPDGVLGAWTTGNTLPDKPTGTTSDTIKGSNTYYWVTGWDSENTSDVATVLFVATKGTETLQKTMNLTKSIPGEPGVSPIIYSIDVSSLTTNKSYTYSEPDSEGNYSILTTAYTPNEITVTATKTIGDSTTPYTDGYIRLYIDGVYRSTSKVNSSGVYTLSGIGSSTNTSPATVIYFELYDGNGTDDKLLDYQSVTVTSDGIKGNKGETGGVGASAISFNFPNPFDNISVNSDGKTTGDVPLTLPFAAFEGSTKITCTISQESTRITIGTYEVVGRVSNASTSSDGSIIYTIPSGTKILDTDNKQSDNGTKALTFTYTTASGHTGTITATYGWSITAAGSVGKDAVFLQTARPYGYLFENGEGSLSIVGTLTEGGQEKSKADGVTYKWYKFDPSLTPEPGYVEIKQTTHAYEAGNTNVWTGINEGASINSDTLIVYGTEVDGFASFKCVANYKSVDYSSYTGLEDKTDPIQVAIISSVGEQIVNGNGTGYFWARVIRNDGNGTELDPLPTGVSFVEEKPTTLVNGAYYYLLDSSAKTVKLYKASSTTQWALDNTYEAENYKCGYRWTYRNYDNEVISDSTKTPATSGKIVYIDASLVNKKIIIDVEVTVD